MATEKLVNKLRMVPPVGKGILYDVGDGSLLFGSEARYIAFKFVLDDRLRNGHLTTEEYNSISENVRELFKEMWHKLREGAIWQRAVRNWRIRKEYRGRLEQHPTLGQYVRSSDSFLGSNLKY